MLASAAILFGVGALWTAGKAIEMAATVGTILYRTINFIRNMGSNTENSLEFQKDFVESIRIDLSITGVDDGFVTDPALKAELQKYLTRNQKFDQMTDHIERHNFLTAHNAAINSGQKSDYDKVLTLLMATPATNIRQSQTLSQAPQTCDEAIGTDDDFVMIDDAVAKTHDGRIPSLKLS